MKVIRSAYLPADVVLVVNDRVCFEVKAHPKMPWPPGEDALHLFAKFGALAFTTLVRDTRDEMISVHATCGTRVQYVKGWIEFCPSCRADVSGDQIRLRPYYETSLPSGTRPRQIRINRGILGTVTA